MSRSVYRAPFHRQIIPWIFAAIFFATAPVLIFYTSGYRLNTKKTVIERNGTLIVDSTPRGARVYIDDTFTEKYTPVTFQNMAPGDHTIRLERDTYHPWEKRLNVRPEQVTFANTVWLWRDVEPQLVLSNPVTALTSSAQRGLLGIASTFDAITTFSTWSPRTGASSPVVLSGSASGSHELLRWSEDGKTILVGGEDTQALTWWSRTDITPLQTNPLPAGLYFWNGNNLHRAADDAVYEVNPQTGSLVRTPLTTDAVDQSDTFALQKATGTSVLLLHEFNFDQRRLSLPEGDWRLAALKNDYALLKNGFQWLSFKLASPTPSSNQTRGGWPDWLTSASQPTAILLNENEVIFWRLDQAPETLWRQSDFVVRATWHRSGLSVFVASKTNVFAFELDSRGGHQITNLGSFDHIYDLSVDQGVLYVAADKNGKHGLWQITLE